MKNIYFIISFLFYSSLVQAQLFGSLAADDFDASQFTSIASITSTDQKDAINTLTKSLKADGVWQKSYFIYPVVGGDATKHSYNLKNPATYQITWVGSPTHSSNGVDFNWSYGRITLNASSVFSVYDNHLSFYTRETYGGPDYPTDIGVADYSVSPNRYFILKVHSPLWGGYGDYIVGSEGINYGGSAVAGFYVGSRTSQSTYKLYRNNVEINSKTTSSDATALPNLSYMCIGGGHWNYTGSANNYSQRQMAFSSGGSSLTNSEAIALMKAVNQYQTKLGRNIY